MIDWNFEKAGKTRKLELEKKLTVFSVCENMTGLWNIEGACPLLRAYTT